MSETENDQGRTPLLQRVRCGHCGCPLVQISQSHFFSPLQRNEEERASQPLPTYSYRLLADSTPLFFCPRCHTPLSSETVTVVLPQTAILEEGKA